VDEQGLVNSRRISGGCKPRRASPKSSAENPETETCPLLAAGLRLIKLFPAANVEIASGIGQEN